MNKADEGTLRELKSLAGQFFEEVKNDSVTGLIAWIDCKLELQSKRRKEMAELRAR